MRAIVAFGANLGDRASTFERAMTLLEPRVGPILARSSLYETPPLVLPGVDPATIPHYLNAVVIAESSLPPLELLRALLQIERDCGRDRTAEPSRWMPRAIDLDLIALDGCTVNTPELTLPHPELHRRRFVLEPLAEVDPEWVHPVSGKTARQLLGML